MYNRYHWDPLPPGNGERLHHDYALINQYVIHNYALSNTITVPVSFEEEPINKLGRFSIAELLAGMETDFQNRPAGTVFFFTPEMADEFIAYACGTCEQGIASLFSGSGCLDEKTLAWRRR